MNSRKCHIKMGCCKREEVYPFDLPAHPGGLTGFYFSCGPLAALGFFINGLWGFAFAIIADAVFWLLIVLFNKNRCSAF
jgi:hypothetical protein